ncbi:hypothetical protein MBLNU459_g3952t1 [Dothideomycetes sp. NU459]
MADDDNFDIDIYGDENPDFQPEPQATEPEKQQDSDHSTAPNGDGVVEQAISAEDKPQVDTGVELDQDVEDVAFHGTDDSAGQVRSETPQQNQQILSTGGSSAGQPNLPKQAPTQQGIKRKQGEDDRELDPGATSALRLGELQWWMTEDDIRGWANQCGCEDELKEITFNEHKVNGKSKGEAFLELASPQAATALKRRIDSFGAEQQSYVKKHTVIYARPDYNPFKTSPKDAPQRNKAAAAGAYNSGPGFSQGGAVGGFRGGRGGYNNRGGMNNMNNGMGGAGVGGVNRGGYNSQQMGMMGGGAGAFNSGMATNFNNNNNNMMGNNFGGGMGGGFNNRGGMMGGMRGGFQNNRGRGGMMGNMGMPNMNMGMGMGMGNMGNMGAMGMGGMGAMGAMGGMAMGMGMGGMGNMGGYNNPQGGHFNPGFFGGAAGGANSASMSPAGNPHGVKRARPE